MSSDDSLDDVRRNALDTYENWDKATKALAAIGMAFELGLGIALIVLTGFWDPVQRLIFLATATVYAPLVVFVIAIGCLNERNACRILKAIDLLNESAEKHS